MPGRAVIATEVGERRCADRQLTMLQLGILENNGEHHPGLILDLGSGGLQFRLFDHVKLGSNIHVKMKGGRCYAGSVAWQRGDLVGISFAEELSPSELQQLLLTLAQARSPRLETNLKVLLRNGASTHVAQLRNISPRGAGLQIGGIKLPFRVVHLRVPGLGNIDGQVRWIQDDNVGIIFNEALSVRQLAMGIRAHGVL